MTHPRSSPSFKSLLPASAGASAAASGSSRKRDTRCEIGLRKELFRLGLRYRIAAAALPGKPDVIFPGAQVAVFCDGDFWHGRDLAARIEKLGAGHNAPYWIAKIRANVARDLRVSAELESAGWVVLRFWETEIGRDTPAIAKRIAALVDGRRGSKR